MAGIQRHRRVACRLKCEIVTPDRRHVRGRVVSISEGGLVVEADLALEQGDPVRLMIEPVSEAPIKLSAIVWNDLSVGPSGASSRIRKLGCVVPEPTRSFRALLDALEPRLEEPRPLPISAGASACGQSRQGHRARSAALRAGAEPSPFPALLEADRRSAQSHLNLACPICSGQANRPRRAGSN